LSRKIGQFQSYVIAAVFSPCSTNSAKIEPWEKLKPLSIPMLFIHGDKDTYVPYSDSVKYSKMLHSARLVTIKDAEHGFHSRKKKRGANRQNYLKIPSGESLSILPISRLAPRYQY
jgi:alpha/beta superfamily hydrolase